ncbi:hypothetical protein BS78_K111100 [Paspalum vaginatum]|uniref:Uncharacterized protein n=1 Tax=Paspalum vaginatum TaxID=158149 RepID=A0A9W7X6M8_9POAL|nr:hypothetical protein BS78_K111100 [Paspalum vaginatum]
MYWKPRSLNVSALPGIEGFQIVGEPRPGFTLTACGFPTNGTTLCNFEGYSSYILNSGATMYDYVVTADDVGTLLAVDCIPMDDNGRQGDIVTEFANGGNKITCDPDMQSQIDACISNGELNLKFLSWYTNIPNGRNTHCVLVTSTGANLPLNTRGISEPTNEDFDIRFRDLMVLVMRTFQKKALDAKRKDKA